MGGGQVPTWERFDPEVDYRQVPTTKPHETHPNFVFIVEEDVWVTVSIHKMRSVFNRAARPFNSGRGLTMALSLKRESVSLR